MGKTNSFRMTFYLGLTIIVLVVSFLTLIIINLFQVLTPKFKKEVKSTYVEEIEKEIEKEIVHDTIYIEKPIIKTNPILKKFNSEKKETTPVIYENLDDITEEDSII